MPHFRDAWIVRWHNRYNYTRKHLQNFIILAKISSLIVYSCYVFPRFIMVTSLVLGQSYDYPSAIEFTPKGMGKRHQYETTTEASKALTTFIILGIYCAIKPVKYTKGWFWLYQHFLCNCVSMYYSIYAQGRCPTGDYHSIIEVTLGDMGKWRASSPLQYYTAGCILRMSCINICP